MSRQLLCSTLTDANPLDRMVTPIPAIVKPRQLWTGKQVVWSALLAVSPVLTRAYRDAGIGAAQRTD